MGRHQLSWADRTVPQPGAYRVVLGRVFGPYEDEALAEFYIKLSYAEF
jgi:hypothetical protein